MDDDEDTFEIDLPPGVDGRAIADIERVEADMDARHAQLLVAQAAHLEGLGLDPLDPASQAALGEAANAALDREWRAAADEAARRLFGAWGEDVIAKAFGFDDPTRTPEFADDLGEAVHRALHPGLHEREQTPVAAG